MEKNVNRLLPTKLAWQTYFPSILRPCALEKIVMRKKRTNGSVWRHKKKNNQSKNVEHKKREKSCIRSSSGNNNSSKQKAKWKCEYIEMRSTILFYIVWHTSHDFSVLLALLRRRKQIYGSTNAHKDNCMAYMLCYGMYIQEYRYIECISFGENVVFGLKCTRHLRDSLLLQVPLKQLVVVFMLRNIATMESAKSEREGQWHKSLRMNWTTERK